MSGGVNIHTVKGERITEVFAALQARVGDERARTAAALVSAARQAANLHAALHQGASTEALCVMAHMLEVTLVRVIRVAGVDPGDAEALLRAVDADTDDALAAARQARGGLL